MDVRDCMDFLDYFDFMDYLDYADTQEVSSESNLTDSFITSDSEEDELTWDSGDSRPAGPSPPSTPRVLMDNTPQPIDGRRQLRPRRRVVRLPPETESQLSVENSGVSQVSDEPELMEQDDDSDTDSDVTPAHEPNLPLLPPLNYNPVSPSSTTSTVFAPRSPNYTPRSPNYSPSPTLPPPSPTSVITFHAPRSPNYSPPPDPPQPQPALAPPQPQPAVETSAQPTTSAVAAQGPNPNDSVLSEGDEGSVCMICMDPLTNSGDHRVVCLRCGHIFGQSCVERWIKVGCSTGAKRCPTCNKKTSLKDVRILFFSKVVPLDTVEKNRLIEEKELMSSQKKAMEMELNRCKLQCEMNRKRYEKRITELEQQYREALESLSKNGRTSAVQKKVAVHSVGAELLHSVELSKEGGCRVLAYCHIMKDLVVSQPSGNTVFAGFGVRVLNTVDFQPVKFVFLHQKMIRDLAFHPEERGILLSVSLDQTAKLVDLNSRCTIHTFKCDGPLWSGCWDATNPHLLLVGSQVGKVFQFDRRMVDTHVNLWEDKLTTPVVALTSVPSMPSTPFPQGGFFSCRLNSVHAYARSRDTYKSQVLPIEGPFMSMKYNYETQTLLTKTRPSSRCRNSLINMNLVDTDVQNNICLPQIHSYSCGSYAPALTRFTLMPYADDTLVVGHHQSARTVNLWSSKTGDLKHSFPVRDAVIDLETIRRVADNSLLATLTEKQVSIYKVA